MRLIQRLPPIPLKKGLMEARHKKERPLKYSEALLRRGSIEKDSSSPSSGPTNSASSLPSFGRKKEAATNSTATELLLHLMPSRCGSSWQIVGRVRTEAAEGQAVTTQRSPIYRDIPPMPATDSAHQRHHAPFRKIRSTPHPATSSFRKK
jgi:hypothetical protein